MKWGTLWSSQAPAADQEASEFQKDSRVLGGVGGVTIKPRLLAACLLAPGGDIDFCSAWLLSQEIELPCNHAGFSYWNPEKEFINPTQFRQVSDSISHGSVLDGLFRNDEY